MPLSDRCSWCGVLIAEHPDTDACAVADEAARADADPLRARVAALADALTAIVHELEIGWEHGEDCGVWATDDQTDERLYPGDLPGRHDACDCGIATLLRKADAALAQPPAVTATGAEGLANGLETASSHSLTECAFPHCAARIPGYVDAAYVHRCSNPEMHNECGGDTSVCHPYTPPATPLAIAPAVEP